VSEALARELLAIPLFPGITPAQQERVAAAIRAAV
jgi:dTDP-4-amino-4,6-dideoxygalactose transaminase